MSSRKRRGLQPRQRAAKSIPTPKNTPGEMTRARHTRLQMSRIDRMIGEGSALGRALETIMRAKRGEREAIEQLHRESGGVILDPAKH